MDEQNYEVKPEYRGEITFRRLNLMNKILPFRQAFDLIFCRNVMIYFSRGNRMLLLDRLHDWLVTGGCLFIGHSETLNGITDRVNGVEPTIYRKP